MMPRIIWSSRCLAVAEEIYFLSKARLYDNALVPLFNVIGDGACAVFAGGNWVSVPDGY